MKEIKQMRGKEDYIKMDGVNITYGTADYRNIKSIFINYATWVKLNEEKDLHKILIPTLRHIKKNINNVISNEKWDTFNIMSNTFNATSVIESSRRTFQEFEITIYPKKEIGKIQDVLDDIKLLSEMVISTYKDKTGLILNYERNNL
jgi:hypothetical protein